MRRKINLLPRGGLPVLLVIIVVGLLWNIYFRHVPVKPLSGRKSQSRQIQPPSRFCDTITVLSYNVENLFDMVDNGGEYPEFKPNRCNWNDYMYQVRLNNIAMVLAAARPDIAVLYEVENKNILARLVDVLSKKGLEYHYSAIGDSPNSTGTNPALLSRYPIIRSQGIGTVKTGEHFSRNILEACVALGPDSLTIFANHWPSKAYSESYRVAAAEILVGRIAALPRGTDYLVTGDLNEDYNECETFFSQGLDDSKGTTGLNHILRSVRSQPYGFAEYYSQDAMTTKNSMIHYDLWLDLPEEKRGSYKHAGRWGTIDHILAPSSLFDSAGLSYLKNSFAVFTMHDSLLRNNEPFRWQVAYGKNCKYHKGEGFSDHLPVMARFYRGPFVRDTTRPPADTTAPKAGIIGLESGYEGWISEEAAIALSRDTAGAHTGNRSLRIEGSIKKHNITAARLCIPAPRVGVHHPGELSFFVKGSAPLCWRVRSYGGKKWVYYVGADLKQARAAKYLPVTYKNWTSISLPVAGISNLDQGIEFEIRTGKEGRVQLWVDDISVR